MEFCDTEWDLDWKFLVAQASSLSGFDFSLRSEMRQAEEVAEKLKLFVILSEAKNPSSI
jgi:hypothetical protein